MSKITIIFTMIFLVVSSFVNGEAKNEIKITDDFTNLGWSSYKNSCEVSEVYDLEKRNKVLKVKSTRGKAEVFLNFDSPLQINGQYKISFWMKGMPENKSATLIFGINVWKEGKWIEMFSTRSFEANSNKWRHCILSFDNDFGLGDNEHTIGQIKLNLGISLEYDENIVEVLLSDLTIVEPGKIETDLTKKGIQNFIIDVKTKDKEKAFNLKPLLIYQGLNNGDYRTLYKGNKTKLVVEEKRSNAIGFGDLLSLPLSDYINNTNFLSEFVDVLVISSPTFPISFPLGKIKELIADGKNVLIVGKNDDAISSILPVKILEDADSTKVTRHKLIIKEKSHPIFSKISLSDITIGRYLKIEPLAGTKVLAVWDDNSPAIVEGNYEKGKIIYFGFGFGQSITNSRMFYDELYLRTIYYLAERVEVISQLPQLQEMLFLHKEIDELKEVISVFQDNKEASNYAIVSNKLDIIFENWKSLAKEFFVASYITVEKKKNDIKENLSKLRIELKQLTGENYYLGASKDNFGRLGWCIEDGFLVHTTNQNLEVTNGIHGKYTMKFFRDETEKIILPKIWKFKTDPSTEGKDKGYFSLNYDTRKWEDIRVTAPFQVKTDPYIGIVWYKTEIFIPSEWKGKKINFVAKKIDDLDNTYINGKLIGKTTQETKNYWEAPRCYFIPTEILNYGAMNTVVVEVENLRGDGGIYEVPEIQVAKEQSDVISVTVEDINWVKKEYLIKNENSNNSYSMIQSLLFPGILYKINDDNIRFGISGVKFLTYLNKDKKEITINLQEESIAYDQSRDGNLSENWMLFFYAVAGEKEKPILIVWEKNPQRIEVTKIGEIVQSLTLHRAGGVGELVVSYPFGIKALDGAITANWSKNFPEEIIQKCRVLSRLSINYPINCDEIYAIDENRNKVKIVNRFSYHQISDEWKTTPLKAVFASPQVSYAKQIGILVTSDENWEDFDLPTKYGPLLGLKNKNTITYEMEIPLAENVIYPNIAGEEKLISLINQHFMEGVKWTAGGQVPYSAYTHKSNFYDKENNFSNMYSWVTTGLPNALTGKEFLDKQSEAKFYERISYRLQKTLELYQHQAVVHYREEPFSSLRYIITFNSVYQNNSFYNERIGSSIIYGDADESSMLIPLIAYYYALYYGEWNFVKTNWPYLKEVAKLMFISDDWAYLATGCREFGRGAHMDMLNCEYSGMRVYAKLAKAIGDEIEYREALYRAIRRAIPTLTRLWFIDYVKKNYDIYGEDIALIKGYAEEDGIKYTGKILSEDPFFNKDIALFNTSKSTDRELILLYKLYAGDKIKEYMKNIFIPSGKTLNKPFTYEGIRTLTLFGELRREDSIKYINEYTPVYLTKPASKDWPGMNQTATVVDVIFSRHPEVFLIDWMPAKLVDSLYASDVLTLNFSNNSKKIFKILLYSKKIPISVVINENKMKERNDWKFDKETGYFEIWIKDNERDKKIEVKFSEEIDSIHPYLRYLNYN